MLASATVDLGHAARSSTLAASLLMTGNKQTCSVDVNLCASAFEFAPAFALAQNPQSPDESAPVTIRLVASSVSVDD